MTDYTEDEIEYFEDVAAGISNPDGNLKLSLSANQAMSWYMFLLEESPACNYSKIDVKTRCEIWDMHMNGCTISEIVAKVSVSKTAVVNVVLNKGYNKMLSRAHATAVRVGDEQEITWAYGGLLCL